ncbi:hypothetical protein FMN63_02295 [Stappia sp. BW2]|uniref:hypothetical protein n=1 Tax=Stappia sp. BW2 TaxID=2592622 RepID=UPI0011DEAB16|nr:hypothetical protein [Stappia sp. BW2]TYC80090.1 hypothetical protein FMN63_02295 [Stappia sp. BW2]
MGERLIKTHLKRLVIYCPGYDLRPTRHCFPMLKKEFDTFLTIRGVDGAFSPLKEGLAPGSTTASWSGRVDWPEGRVDTTFVQLGWRDVIKPDFQRSWPRTIWDALRSFLMIAQAGGYRAALRSNWAHGVFCLYPPVGLFLYFLASLLPPLLLAPVIFRNVAAAIQGEHADEAAWAVFLGSSAAWLVAVYLLMTWLEPRSFFRYLVNSWHFMARLARSDHPDMVARIEESADLIVAAAAEAEDDTDLVFVSHSCGTFVAIYILAAVLRRQPDIVRRPGGFSFVTLGPAFDCLGAFGPDGGFGDAVTAVARSGVDWTDLYGPHDPLCGGRTAPVARYARPAGSSETLPEPRRYSVRIPDRMTADRFRHLRFRFFALHFNYFFASVRPGLFDFFRLTLGPRRAVDQLKAWDKGRTQRPCDLPTSAQAKPSGHPGSGRFARVR